MEIIPILLQSCFTELRHWDNSGEVVVYISHIEGMNISSNKSSTSYFKFTVNNNDGQVIPVIAWNNQAIRVEKLKLQCNQVIHQDGLRVRAVPSQYKFGTQTYELCIESNTVITILGERKIEILENGNYPSVDLKDLGKSKGVLVTEGWIKKNFAVLHSSFNNMADTYYGYITDGEYKLHVKIKDFAKDHMFQRCQCIQLIGSFQNNRGENYFLVNSMADIKPLEKPDMPLIKILAPAKDLEV